MTTLTVADKVARLVKFATGEEYGDGETVTDVIHGYAEPGYGSSLSDETPVIVLGNWNPKRFAHDGDAPLTLEESLPVRLGNALERVGAELEWLDEWTQCSNCYRAIRTVENSYSWKPSYVVLECDYVCHDCALAMGEDALEPYVNNPSNAVTWCEPSHVESFGYVKWESHDPHTYESGWHPGQNDDPQTIFDGIVAAHDEPVDVVFLMDEHSQFYIRFSAYVRPTPVD